jgi:signal transduction histidine kinase
MANKKTIKFNFDVSTFRLIGRELITDRITALVELVKNAYDANAENVTIIFESVGQFSNKSKITISDDGIGMSLDDIKNKWMIIGTSSKRKNQVSPAPYNRVQVGKKGIGRFAVDKLGSNLLLKTTQNNMPKILCVQNDWTQYEKIENDQLELDFSETRKYFTDIENNIWEERKGTMQHGTTLEITNISEVWTEADIARVYRELSKLISPFYKIKYPFNITIVAPETKEYASKKVKSFAFEEAATYQCELNYNGKRNQQEKLQFKDGKLYKTVVEKPKCGLLKMHLYYFDQEAKKKFKQFYSSQKIDGIKIYRDGILTTPFAENVDNADDQKDILGIDKRRWSGFFDKIDTHDLLGWIEISDDMNPGIIEATNRQGFVDNDAWKSLKEFVIEQIACIEDMLKWQRDNEKRISEIEFKETKDSFSKIREIVKRTKSKDPEIKQNFATLNKELGKLQGTINKVQSDMAQTNKEKERVEDLLFSLVSVQTYAGMLSHIVRTMIGKIKDRALFLYDKILDPNYNDKNKKYAKDIFDEMNGLSKAVDFLLRYSKDSNAIEDVPVVGVVSHLLNDVYADEFKKKNIKTEIVANSEITIRYNEKALEDIFDNLISNSFKEFNTVDELHLIKITIETKKQSLIIHYSNNGKCISEENKDKIFNIFYTTTADQGGAGLGLYIIKTRIESVNGTIRVVDNEFKPNGVTFEIIIPFKGVNK